VLGEGGRNDFTGYRRFANTFYELCVVRARARRRGPRAYVAVGTHPLFPGGVASLNRRLPAGTPAGVLGKAGAN